MNNRLKLLTIGSIAFTLSSCFAEKPLVTSKADNNESYKIEYLFEHDGCKLYRFKDMGNYIYFSNCKGDVTSISNDSTKVRIQTMGR